MLLLLALQRFGMRTIEAVVLLLIATIGVCYFIEIFVLPQTQPSFLEMGRALFSPQFRQSGVLYLAIGIIGATVMPHNLYLHSALVQSRKLMGVRFCRFLADVFLGATATRVRHSIGVPVLLLRAV